jgi:antibiotic biosynthesis monooxygenase (ABM) superfamily enzyme
MTAPAQSQPIHVAITRRVRPGCEAEFMPLLVRFARNWLYPKQDSYEDIQSS